MKITIDDVLEEKSIFDLVVEAKHEAIRNGIKANSIVINSNLVKVPGSFGEYPEMICGLKSHRTSCELPEDYIFAVVHDPSREPEHEMRWIPVTERLPEEMDIYLVVVKSKYDFEDQYEIDTDVATYNPHEKAYIDGCWDTYCDWDEGQQYLHITHWMPLPQAPKEGE